MLRPWLRKDMGQRPIAEAAGVDRKTAVRYIEAAVGLGLDRDRGPEQLTDELIGAVVAQVRPDRPRGHGATGPRGRPVRPTLSSSRGGWTPRCR